MIKGIWVVSIGVAWIAVVFRLLSFAAEPELFDAVILLVLFGVALTLSWVGAVGAMQGALDELGPRRQGRQGLLRYGFGSLFAMTGGMVAALQLEIPLTAVGVVWMFFAALGLILGGIYAMRFVQAMREPDSSA